MNGNYTYDEPVLQRAYEVTCYADGATGVMPEMPFEERQDDNSSERP